MPRSSAIIVQARKSDRHTEPIRSDAASCSRTPTSSPPLRSTRPASRHSRKSGTVTGASASSRPSHWPIEHRNQCRRQRTDQRHRGHRRLRGTDDHVAVRAAGSAPDARRCRRISRSATGPPMTPPSTRPSVAEVMVSAITPGMALASPNFST